MTSLPDRKRWTVDDYLAFDRASEQKWEYLDGMVFDVFAMAGASVSHNRIVVNLTVALGNQLQGGACEVFSNDTRVRIRQEAYAYPDLVIVCGVPQFEGQQDILVNPAVIVEVLSPGTETYDRTGKFHEYQKLASLQEYVLVAQDRPLVESFTRTDDGWLYTFAAGLDTGIAFKSVGCTVALRDIYQRVQFDP